MMACLMAAAAGIQSCYYDKADALYPSAVVCDSSTVVSYAQKVVPLFQQQCYSCHLSAASGGGILMGNHAADKAIAVNGKLYGSMSHARGYSAMPKGGNKMNACQLALVKKWVDAGAPNN